MKKSKEDLKKREAEKIAWEKEKKEWMAAYEASRLELLEIKYGKNYYQKAQETLESELKSSQENLEEANETLDLL